MTDKLVIQAFWDPEAEVWVATSNDVPGLVTEANTIESLLNRLAEIVPELLQLNGVASGAPRSFELVTSHSLQPVN